jgi:hypothetical protein
MAGNPPTLPPVEGTDSGFNPNFDSPARNGDGYTDGAPIPPEETQASVPVTQAQERQPEAQDAQTQEQVKRVLYSDIGVNTLLARLKASIASARVTLPEK